MGPHQPTREGASALSPETAQLAVEFAVRLVLANLSSPKAERVTAKTREHAAAIERQMKVAYLRATGDDVVRPLRLPDAEQVSQRKAQLDAVTMLIRALDAKTGEGRA